jgi:tetratricopeptide (TPR) repeat protein
MRIVATIIVTLLPACGAGPFSRGAVSETAETNQVCAADPEPTLARMRELHRERKWTDLIEQFRDVDFSIWPAESADQSAEALHLRGQAYSMLKQGRPAETDLKAAVKLAPRLATAWLNLADNYANNLQDDRQALDAYRQVLAITGRGNGWQSISATLATARILTDQVRTDEALETLKPYDAAKGVAPIWRIRLLRAYGHIYAAQGNEQESLARFREALELESKQ